MASIKSLLIKVEPSTAMDGVTEMLVEVRAVYDSGVIKVHTFKHVFLADHFTSLWERVMERAQAEICASVREAQVSIDG